MNNKIIKSIWAVFAGLLFIGVSHNLVDLAFHYFGILPWEHMYVDTWLILIVIGYRAVLSVVGCYITAMLAPEKPLKHAIILGAIGVVISSVAAIATADMNLGPAWYTWSLVAISLPVSYIGGKMYIYRNKIS